MSSIDEESRLRGLRDSIESLSSSTSRALLPYGTLGIYLFLGASATSHEQLLFQQPVKLPFIELSVPTVTFFIAAPLLFVMLHIYALVQTVMLSERLIVFEKELKLIMPIKSSRRLFRGAIDSNLISRVLGITDASMGVRILSFLLTWAILAAAPLLVLLAAQVCILPYHSELATWGQRFLIATDAMAIIVLLRPAVVAGTTPRWIAWPAYGLILYPPVLAVVLSFTVILIPEEYLELRINAWLPNSFLRQVPFPKSLLNFPDSSMFGPPSQTPRNVSLATFYFFEAPRTPFGIRRNLILSGVRTVTSRPTDAQVDKLGEREAWSQFGKGIDLSGRDLRFADLSNADLRRADLRGASIRGAFLDGARLDYVVAIVRSYGQRCAGKRLSSATCAADFTGARLWQATARYGEFRGAIFEATDFQSSHLEHADFSASTLGLASFQQAKMGGAKLSRANAVGTSFANAELEGSDLDELRAQAADFSGAFLAASRMINADISGAYMGGSAIFLITNSTISRQSKGVTFVGTRLNRKIDVEESTAEVRAAIVGPPSQKEIDDIVKRIDESDLKSLVKGRLEHGDPYSMMVEEEWLKTVPGVDAKNSSRPSEETEVVSKEASPDIADQLLELACPGGKGNTFVALGILRRAKQEFAVKGFMEEAARHGFFKQWFGGSEELARPAFEIRFGSSDHHKWERLKQRLQDPNLCGATAESVRRHDSFW